MVGKSKIHILDTIAYFIFSFSFSYISMTYWKNWFRLEVKEGIRGGLCQVQNAEDVDQDRVCGKFVRSKDGNTSGYKSHMRKYHPKLWDDYMEIPWKFLVLVSNLQLI